MATAKSGIPAAAVVALGLALVGCTASTPGGMDDSPSGMDMSEASNEQAAAFDDREVTLDEYQAAFTRYRECLGAAGHELNAVTFDDHEYRYVVSTDAVESGADDECYRTEFYYVDMYWQTSDRLQDASRTTP